ncbi:MAG: Gfo/Idh/MocA family oxidoreductase [Chloroflexi bacterium]|nr:Gfo/Idh/MocA family oxidoreductase [Chloroflexota bacterium]
MIKSLLKAGIHTLPGPIRRQVLDYYGYVSKRRSLERLQNTLPYWERREKQGDKPPVRVGFVGAGNYARHHLKVLNALQNVSVEAILTTGSPRGRAVADEYGIPYLFTDRQAFLAERDVDCYVIVASAWAIKPVAMDCLAKAKPVLLEKPAGVSPEETAALTQQAKRYGTYGMVCMNRRFYSVIEHGLATLATYGPIRGAILEIPERITDERQSQRLTEWDYDHLAFRNSVHGIDLLRYILGDVKEVHSIARPHAPYANAAASFGGVIEHEGGGVSTVLALWDTQLPWRLTLIAENGRLRYAPFERGWFVNEKGVEIPIRMDEIDVSFRSGVYAQDLHFIESVRRGKRPTLPACLLSDALKTNSLIDRLYGGGSMEHWLAHV